MKVVRDVGRATMLPLFCNSCVASSSPSSSRKGRWVSRKEQTASKAARGKATGNCLQKPLARLLVWERELGLTCKAGLFLI